MRYVCAVPKDYSHTAYKNIWEKIESKRRFRRYRNARPLNFSVGDTRNFYEMENHPWRRTSRYPLKIRKMRDSPFEWGTRTMVEGNRGQIICRVKQKALISKGLPWLLRGYRGWGQIFCRVHAPNDTLVIAVQTSSFFQTRSSVLPC